MNQKHTHKRKNHRNQKLNLERFISTRFFIILGVLFLLIGLYYMLSSTDGTNSLIGKIMSLFKPSIGQNEGMVINRIDFATLILFFLPALFGLIISCWYAKKYSSITYPVTLIISIYLIVLQVLLYISVYTGGSYYPNFFIASVVLFFLIILLFVSAFLHRKLSLLIFICFLFYISQLLWTSVYSSYYLHFLFISILLFSVAIEWLGKKIEQPIIHIINFVFAIGFLGLVYLRKFVVNSKPEFLIEFITFSILFYLLFYALELYSSKRNEKAIYKWMQFGMILMNMLFFLCCLSFILLKYYTYMHLCFFVPGLLVFNVFCLLLINKYKPDTWLLPYYYIVITLAALVLPLILQQNRLFLFMATYTILMSVYGNRFKEKSALRISIVTLTMTVGLYVFLWIDSYLPAIIMTRILPETSLILNGVISNVFVLFVIFLTKKQLDEDKVTGSRNRLIKNNYHQLLSVLLFITLYLTMGWVVFSLTCLFTGLVINSSVGWFISGSIFFIIFIRYYAGKKSEFKKPLVYLAFIQILFYPLLLGWNVASENIFHSGILNINTLLVHYLAIILLLVLGIMSVKRIYQRNTKNIAFKQIIQILSVVYIGFLLCTEFDNLSLIILYFQTSINAGFHNGITLLTSNQFIPYSIILWLLSVFVFVYAIFNKKSFLRNFSILLFTVVLIKVFVFDFKVLEQGGRSIVFFVLGIFIIIFALVYPRMMKAANNDKRLVINDK